MKKFIISDYIYEGDVMRQTIIFNRVHIGDEDKQDRGFQLSLT